MADKQAKPHDLANPLEGLTVLNIRFLENYARTGNISRSWMEAYGQKNQIIAYTTAYNFLKKHPGAKRAVLEAHGIDDSKIANALKDGFEATSFTVYRGKKITHPDGRTRLKAAELADRMFYGDDRGKTVGNQLNIQINTEKGEFKISEG